MTYTHLPPTLWTGLYFTMGASQMSHPQTSLIFLLTVLIILPCGSYNTIMGEDEIPKSFFHGWFRRFAFPPGTFLIFTPELTIPAWRDYPLVTSNRKSNERARDVNSACEEDIVSKSDSKAGYPPIKRREEEDVAAIKNSAIEIASPFYIYFDKLGWTHEDSIYNMPPQLALYIQEYLVDPTLQIFGVPPREQPRRSVNSMAASKKSLNLSESHRLMLFRKIEDVLEDVGIENGKACLLRAICEMQEFPLDLVRGKHGIFGEMLVLLLRVTPDENDKVGQGGTSPCISVYTRAAALGRDGNCSKYFLYCSHSIFQWSWRANFLK